MKSVILVYCVVLVGISSAQSCIESMSWPMIMNYMESILDKHNLQLSSLVMMSPVSQVLYVEKRDRSSTCPMEYYIHIEPCAYPPVYVFGEDCECQRIYKNIQLTKIFVTFFSKDKRYLTMKKFTKNILVGCKSSREQF